MEVIENTELAKEKFNEDVDTCGTTKVELTKEQMDSLLEGKCIALFDGEYTTFLTKEKSKLKVERIKEFVIRVTEPDGRSRVIELCPASQTWKVLSNG